MRRLVVAALVVVFAAPLCVARADDKANPTGTWKWSFDAGGKTRSATLKLKLDGDKLTGTITYSDKMESKIEGGKFKDGEVTFTAMRELMDQKFTIKYSAKIDGDTLKGKAEVEFGGETQKLDFEGKREKEKDKK